MSGSESTPRRYELLDRIAVGGMAEVFRARAHGAHGFQKLFALKRILWRLARDPQFEKRFIAEAKLAAELNHANIVQVTDFGHLAGSLYIAMEYVDGMDLRGLLRAHQRAGEPVPLKAALQISLELCKGLDFAHRKGVVHRDISPSNILLSRSGEVKVADFGIARASAADISHSSANMIIGKRGYMSPEQTHGKALDGRSDIFSTGVVLHELFANRRLFPSKELGEALKMIHHLEIPLPSSMNPGVPPELDQVVMGALQRRPDDRYARASDMVTALTEVCFARKLVPGALDVAEAVERAVEQSPERSAEGPVNAAPEDFLDKFIQEELARAGVAGGGAPTRMTAQARPAEGGAAGELPNRSKTLPMFVVRDSGPDGMTRLELAIPDDAVSVSVDFSPTPAPEVPPADAEGAFAAGEQSQPALAKRHRSDELSTELRRVARSPIGWGIAIVLVVIAGSLTVPFLMRGDPPTTASARADAKRGSGAASARDEPASAEPGPASADVESASAAPDSPSTAVASADPTTAETEATVTPATGRGDKTRPARGSIDVYVEPWAYIYFKGRKIAEAPVKGLRLPVGRHRLTLSNPVKKTKKVVVVEVPADAPYRFVL